KAESLISYADWDPSSFEIYESFSKLYHSIGEEKLGNAYLKIYNDEMEAYHGIKKENLELVANRYFEQVEKEERVASIIFYTKLIVGSLLSVFMLVLIYNRIESRTSKAEIKRDKMVSDLKALKAQINPHFLFNSLNSIQSFILEGEESLADDYLVKYGKLMRMILNHSNELAISIVEEIAALKLYVELEQLRLGKELNFVVKVADEIEADLTKIPSMVIQPLIENAIWHGIQPKAGGGELLLDISQEGNQINVLVADNGVGFDAGEGGEKKPHGLKLAQERIDILNEVNRVKSSFGVSSNEKGTQIKFSYPCDLS
ncbi:MAG: histidine kinase, partial [Bacteroidota bacterium]